MNFKKLTKEDIDKVRNMKGFPQGSDEDIMEMSNAPFYTACPNPFIEDFIAENGKSYDSETDNYHREPYASDVSEGKSDDLYNMHTYHTKVPPKAILNYILHYTNPGDIVYDAFSGSGMTGVACALAGQQENSLFGGNYGTRYCVLSDISVAATYIAQGYNYPISASNSTKVALEALEWLRDDFGWAYQTKHSNGEMGEINYTVWSDVLTCPQCGAEIVFYEEGMDKESGHKRSGGLCCPKCNFEGKAAEFERARITVFDEVSGEAIEQIKEKPVLINYTYKGKKYDKEPDAFDLEIIEKINEQKINIPYPTDEIPDGFNTSQPKKSHLVSRIDLFYTKRNLIAFAKLWNYVEEKNLPEKGILRYWLQSVSVGFTKTNRYFSSSFSQVNRYLKGTLYIAPVRSEVSPWYSLTGKAKKLQKLIPNPNCIISCMSSEKSLLPDNSIDYIFIDPPFGSNIMYSDLNIIWEAWLRLYTQSNSEAIINDAANKDDDFYKELMLKVLKDCYRVIKPNRWITIEFHNSQNRVWNILQSVINQSGFVVADVRILDKQVQTMKQYSTKNSVDKDLVISAYKPGSKFIEQLSAEAGSEQSAWLFTRQHLENLPVVVKKDDSIEVVSERQAFMLWDRMVAYHIMNGIPVPLDATTFYSGLEEKFLKRDNMFFLPDQVNEYDLARVMTNVENLQLSLFVSDEKTAIGWLYQQLDTPQSYQELMPKYTQELKAIDKHEDMPELIDLLKENFVQNDDGKWYVPDLSKAGDVAKLRERSLLKEFQEYLEGSGKLTVFRSEAIRVGFASLWKNKDYAAIIKVAERLPEETIQEDQNLLMYYDISLSRV